MAVVLTTKAEDFLAATIPAEATIRDGTTMMESLRTITTIGTLAIVITTMITSIGIGLPQRRMGLGVRTRLLRWRQLRMAAG